ncbi:MAG TPA: molecular chaperone DnaK [Planctomycetaceae bacterium]|nr:molecular chaperone DnaK [Planctomycetaceae bacterium]
MARKDAIAKLKSVLVSRRDALRKALDGDFSALQALRDQASGDVVDFALDSAQDELNSQLAEVESRELKQIETAIKKMADGSYGICEMCEKNIPLARLNALPYASHCISCQTKVETLGEDWNREEENDEVFS